MPPLIHDDESDVEIPHNHTESNVEADVHAKDQLKDELMDDIEAHRGPKAAKKEKQRVSPTASNADEEEAADAGSEEEDAEAYEVESIAGHEWRKKKRGKGHTMVLLYNVKWKGYESSDNTLEPEENLVSSRDLLAAYHHKIGGAPQPSPPDTLKKKRSSKSVQHESTASAAEESPAPPSKRQKKMNQEDGEASDAEAAFGSWVPTNPNWDKDIKTIETVERDQESNDLYILLLFKNGKKSRVKNNVMRKKAPQSLLNFYEAHLSV